MLRFRRYRVFISLAVFTVLLLYHFTSVRDWEDAKDKGLERLGYPNLKNTVATVVAPVPTPTPIQAPEHKV